MKLPPRRILRLIVQDAIDDRLGFADANRRDEEVRSQTLECVREYRAFQPRLSDDAPALSDADRDLLARACMHARIWREGLVASWQRTGDKATLLEARQDVDRVTRAERALGVQPHWLAGGDLPEGVETVSIFELRQRGTAFRDLTDLVA